MLPTWGFCVGLGVVGISAAPISVGISVSINLTEGPADAPFNRETVGEGVKTGTSVELIVDCWNVGPVVDTGVGAVVG